MSLKRKAMTGALWNFSASGFSQIINFAIYVFLARLVDVEGFGLVAFAFLIIEFCSIFVTTGINQNLIQKEKWCNEFASSAFWFLILLSIGISLFLLLVISPITYFFYSLEAANLICALSIVPIINGIRMVHNGKLQRNFENKKLAVFDSSGVFIGGGLALLLAFNDFGAWSIAIGRICQSIFSTFLTVIGSGFRPKRSIKLNHVKALVAFGVPLLNMAIMRFFANKTMGLVVALVIGPAAFAFVAVANRGLDIIGSLTMQSLNKMVLPTLSRVGKLEVPSAYYRITSLTAFLITPIYFGLGAVAEPLVSLTFGDKWADSAILITISSTFALPMVMGWYIPNVLVSQGFTKAAFKVSLINLSFNVILPIAASFFGLKAIVFSAVLAVYISFPLRFKILSAYTNISLFQSIKRTLPFSLSSVAMSVSLLTLIHGGVLEGYSSFIQLAILVPTGTIIYIVLLLLLFKKDTFIAIRELKSIRGH
ncbi:oligosaccharide flippase family protein [Alteromonadaceae bacterium BrNp21-10]|nr:oligosaccharide flippase family protein [Alteromonadaceae bacterium BrNp21-10]